MRWGALESIRTGFFSIPVWDVVLSTPIATDRAGQKVSGDLAPPEFRRRWVLELVESALVALFLVFFVIRPFVVQAFYIPSPSMVQTLKVNDRILVNKFIYHVRSPRRGDIVVFEPPARATDKTDDDWIKRVVGLPGDHIRVDNEHLYLNGKAQKEPYVSLLERGSEQVGEDPIVSNHFDYVFPSPDTINIAPGQNAYVYPDSSTTLSDAINSFRYTVKVTTDQTPKANVDYLFFIHNDPKNGLEAVVPPGKVFVMGDNRNDSEDSHYWGYLDKNRVLGQAFCIFWPVPRIRLLPGTPPTPAGRGS